MSVAAQSYVAAVLKDGGLKSLLKHGKIDHLFRSEQDKALFKFVDDHARTYGKLPDVQTVLTHAKVDLPGVVAEPPEYYLDLLKKGYVEFSLRQAAKAAEALLHGDSKDPLAALDKMRAGVTEIDARQVAPFVVDYRESGERLWKLVVAKMLGGADMGLQFGWPTLDAMCGGIQAGDVVSWAGRPGLGKTWLMLYSAFNVWLQGRPVLFVSMETKPDPVLQRISAIHAKISPNWLKTGEMTTGVKKEYKEILHQLPDMPHPFYVVDGNLKAMVSDIQALALQLKPGAIFIDGAYLLKHPSEKDRYRRVAENMDLIKMDLTPIAPTVCSWQFNREAKKLKQGEEPSLDHIGYSDTIGQHSSLVLGLFEEDSVETEVRRKVSVLKGRQGETGHFFTKWDFGMTCDFGEWQEEKLEDLQF